MNPLLEEDETDFELVRLWRTKNQVAAISRSTDTQPQTKSIRTAKKPKKGKLKLAKPVASSERTLSREQMDRILESYNFQGLHDRIMRKILG